MFSYTFFCDFVERREYAKKKIVINDISERFFFQEIIAYNYLIKRVCFVNKKKK